MEGNYPGGNNPGGNYPGDNCSEGNCVGGNYPGSNCPVPQFFKLPNLSKIKLPNLDRTFYVIRVNFLLMKDNFRNSD